MSDIEQKYCIGDPIVTKDSKWKGYIAWWYGDDHYQISCKGYKTYSHTSKIHEDRLKPRKMPKREIKTQQAFRDFAVVANPYNRVIKKYDAMIDSYREHGKARSARVRKLKDTIATLTQERDKWEDVAAERMAKLIIREATLDNCTEHLNRWTLASGCNGLRNVDGHLEHILDALDKAEQERNTAQATARVLAERLSVELRNLGFGRQRTPRQLITEATAKAKEMTR